MSADKTVLVTISEDVQMEAETSGAGAGVAIGVDEAVTVVTTVVGDSDSATIVVERIVSVTGGSVLAGSVTVCVEPLVTICVSGGAAPSDWLPSTATTEYGAFLRATCASPCTSERGNALATRVKVQTDNRREEWTRRMMREQSGYLLLQT